MTRAVVRDPIYRRRRFPAEVIELCVLSTYQGYQSGGSAGSLQGLVASLGDLAVSTGLNALGGAVGGGPGVLVVGVGGSWLWQHEGGTNGLILQPWLNSVDGAINNSLPVLLLPPDL